MIPPSTMFIDIQKMAYPVIEVCILRKPDYAAWDVFYWTEYGGIYPAFDKAISHLTAVDIRL